MPFMKEVLVQLEGKVPEETLEKLARTLLREMQYQQLRDTAYGSSSSALSEVRQSLKPLEEVSKTQRYLVDHVKSLLVFQEETKKNYTHLVESIDKVQQYTQKGDTFFQTLKEILENEEKKIQEQALMLNALQENLNKIFLDCQTFFQKQAEKHSEETQKQSENLQQQVAQLQKDIVQYELLLKNVSSHLEKMGQEKLSSTILHSLQEIQKNIQQIPAQSRQEEFLKKLGDLFHQDLQSLEEKTLKEIDLFRKNLESNGQKIPENLEKNLRELSLNLEQSQKKISNLETIHLQSQESFQKHWSILSNKIEEFSGQLYRIQEMNAKNTENPVQENLQEFKNILSGVKNLAQSLQILQHLPEKLNIPENFSAVVESIPASNRKIKEYIELFRQDLSLVSQHSLELLKANREQTAEFAKLQTALVPEIHALQQSWQKFGLKLDDHWTGSQEILGKNMGELVASIAQMKASLSQIGQIQERPRPSYESSSITQEIKDYVRDRMEIAVQNIKESLESAIVNIKKDLKSAISQEIRQMADEIKSTFQSVKSTEIEKSQKNLQPLESMLDEMHKTMNRIDLRMIPKEDKSFASEEKVSSTCPHCGKEVIGPVSFQGKRVSCPACKDKFTFPTIIKP